MAVKAYARVSTDGQTLEAQHELLRDAGASLVFSEKQSGAKTDRAALARMVGSLALGDGVLVSKLDRLARSTRDLLNTLDEIAKAGATFKSLGDPWADTTTPHGRLMLLVLSGLAEFERHLILTRTEEGRVRAKARGVRFGRKPKLTKHQLAEALARIASGETLTAIARSYNVSHMTISRLALLWQIFSGTGFPNQFFNDSWVVGFWRADHGRHNQLGRRASRMAQAVLGSPGP